MGALELFGHMIYLCIGVFIGASIMYFFEVYMDWREDREEAEHPLLTILSDMTEQEAENILKQKEDKS